MNGARSHDRRGISKGERPRYARRARSKQTAGSGRASEDLINGRGIEDIDKKRTGEDCGKDLPDSTREIKSPGGVGSNESKGDRDRRRSRSGCEKMDWEKCIVLDQKGERVCVGSKSIVASMRSLSNECTDGDWL